MVTKRKPPKQNSEQGAPAKPARPSVKGKTVARGEARPDAGTRDAKAAGAVSGTAKPTSAAGAQKPAESHKPKRRIAMPQSSSRLKQNQAANASGDDAKGATGAGVAAGTEPAKPTSGARTGAADKPTPRRRVKSFPVAKAEKTAGDEAQKLAGKVSKSDVAAAEDAARASLVADAAKRRLERRQRKLQHQAEPDVAAESADEKDEAGKGGFAIPRIGRGKRSASGVSVADSAGQGDKAAEQRAPKKHTFHMSWPLGIGLAVLAIVVAVVSVFSWGRWAQYDDAADFQGAWYANGTTSIVTVDGEKIHLTDDVAYNYTLDTGAKTITFTFGQMEGHGRYRFSVDRSELVITDGNDFTFWGNLFDDIGWQLGQAIANLQGQEVEREAAVDGVTVLDRTQTQGAAAVADSGKQAGGTSGGEADGSEDATAGSSVEGDDALSAGTDNVSAGDDSGSSTANAGSSSSGSGDSSFTGGVAEGGIESAGSNAVTLEQLKSGSL